MWFGWSICTKLYTYLSTIRIYFFMGDHFNWFRRAICFIDLVCFVFSLIIFPAKFELNIFAYFLIKNSKIQRTTTKINTLMVNQ